MKDTKARERRVGFQGVPLSDLEANRVGLAVILGILVLVIIEAAMGTPNKYISFGSALVTAAISYYAASKVFKKKREK